MGRASGFQLRVTIQQGTSPLRVALSGDLDERADLGELVRQTAQRIVLDLGELGRINSIGVRRWVHALEPLTRRPLTKIVLARCSPAFVAQALMIPNMTEGARIESIFVSHWCEGCARGEDVLVEAADQLEELQACPTCRQAFEPDPSGPLIADLLRAHG
jgi:hypothetical protein